MIDALLEELLAEPLDATAERVDGAFDRIAAPYQDRAVIFGCGELGRSVLPAVRSAGIQPVAYCDNRSTLWGSEIDGVPVLSPVAAVEQYGGSAWFLPAIYNASAVRQQLAHMGAARVVPYPIFFWKHWRHLPNEERLELPQRIVAQADEIPEGYELLADGSSRREFLAQLRWRCRMEDSLPPADPADEMYFPADLVRLTASETFVDCGAFDGDSLRAFMARSKGVFRRIVAFEPDARNREALARYVAGLNGLESRIVVLPYALGRTDGVVRFSASGAVNSKVVADEGAIEVECRSLDSALAGESPTFIKMDIEGAEVEAIPGAAGTIARCRPTMAVCAYHRCEHLWTIPKLLRAVYPESRIYLRRYAEECWETVYYAIPEDKAYA